MGFQRKQYRLKWPEGEELHGLEVVTAGLSIGDLEAVAAMRQEAEGATSFDRIMPMLEIFAKSLISWNYEGSDGTPIGTQAEDIKRDADARDIIPVILAWVGEVGDIPAPLTKASDSGQQSPELNLPMEAL
jgi:hypothetical protein